MKNNIIKLFILIIIFINVLSICIYINNDNADVIKYNNADVIKYNKAPPIIINIPSNKTDIPDNRLPDNTIHVNTNYNENRLTKRLSPPSKYYPTRIAPPTNQPVNYIPINTPTRGMPTQYQQIGILTNNQQDIKPLYCRQTYAGSQHWNYYSSTDSNLSLKIPVYITNNKCTDERGCTELRDADTVNIGNNNDIYTVTLYSNDDYRYIPYIL